MDLLMLLHVFVKFALFQSKPSWSLAQISMFEAFVVEVKLLYLLKFATCGFGLDLSFLRSNSQQVPKTIWTEVLTQVVDWIKALNQVRLLNVIGVTNDDEQKSQSWLR